MVRRGRWQAIVPGVYRMASTPVTWELELRAAILWAGRDAVASHRCAAHLWDLDGFSDPPPPEVTAPYAHSVRVDGVIAHRTRRLRHRDTAMRKGFPVTAVDRTLVDLCALLEPHDLEIAVESAFRQALSHPERLVRRTLDLAGRRGIRTLREVLRIRPDAVAHSEWEVKLLQLIRDAGLPPPERQPKVWDGTTWRQPDLAYVALMIALEYDSHRWHYGRADWERTITRTANLTAIGWRVLPITMTDIDDHPAATAAKIRNLLRIAA